MNALRVRLSARASSFVILAASLGVSASAHAFERQWHLGVGPGIFIPKDAAGPSLGVAAHAAYGLSDEFDARFTLATTRTRGSEAGARLDWFSTGTLGVTYKLDIIEWVPYFGVRTGYYRFETPSPSHSKHGGLIGAMAGLDYSITRSTAVGAEVGYDALLPASSSFSAVLRAEYRWGF